MKNIIISGSSGQIGSYISKSMSDKYNVIKMDINSDDPVDATNEQQVEDFFSRYTSRDVVAIVNCLGNSNSADNMQKTLNDISSEDFLSILQSNLVSLFVIMKNYISTFSDGNIINLSSLYSVVSPRLSFYEGIKHPGYVASKFGLVGLVKYMAVLGAKKNIKVNCIAPGAVLSTLGVEGDFLKKYEDQCPLKRGVTLEDVYKVVNMLCDNENITGQNIVIDAGYSVW